METLSYSAFRGPTGSVLDKVNDDHKPLLITRQNGRPAVLMSLEDYEGYEKTAYLMASPKNHEQFTQAIAAVESAQAVPHELIED